MSLGGHRGWAWPLSSWPGKPPAGFRVNRVAPLTIDGKLDEAGWAAAPVVTPRVEISTESWSDCVAGGVARQSVFQWRR